MNRIPRDALAGAGISNRTACDPAALRPRWWWRLQHESLRIASLLSSGRAARGSAARGPAARGPAARGRAAPASPVAGSRLALLLHAAASTNLPGAAY